MEHIADRNSVHLTQGLIATRVLQRLEAVREAQRPALALWLPVFFAIGIGVYFAIPSEPSAKIIGTCLAGGVAAAAIGIWWRVGLVLLLGFACLGFGWASLRTQIIAAPVLNGQFTSAVEGRIIGLDRSQSNAQRVLLDQVYLPGRAAHETPTRLRISLHGFVPDGVLEPGRRITTTARIGPPGAPVEPGGFDFRRMAWFKQIGAVGYTRNPVLSASADAGTGLSVQIFRVRMALADVIRARMPAREGAFAAAILTGDRSALDPALMDSLRASNLAHLLAISGLHMGLLTGFVFAVLRSGLALVPSFALRFPVKKAAALVALFAGAAYLMLSGANVATQRAFIMTAVVLVAVMLDRPAFTLRAVAIAAAIVLLIRPESLTEAGFQMSFAATTALIATFNGLRGYAWWHALGQGRWRRVQPVIVLALTSSVAGAATAPFSAFHFNQVAQYGLLANVAAVPAMGLIVMPAAVVALCLAPLGLSSVALAVMGYGIAYILLVADWIAGLDGALWRVPTGPEEVLPLVATGGLTLALWQGRGRIVGVVPVAIALMLWAQIQRPDVLIAENGRLFGVLTPQGRTLNTDRGNSFAAASWLENDGDAAGQIDAALRPGAERGRQLASATLVEWGRLQWTNAKVADPSLCRRDTILLAPKWEGELSGPCVFVGKSALEDMGAIAISVSPDGKALTFEGARPRSGQRPWTSKPGRQ